MVDQHQKVNIRLIVEFAGQLGAENAKITKAIPQGVPHLTPKALDLLSLLLI